MLNQKFKKKKKVEGKERGLNHTKGFANDLRASNGSENHVPLKITIM